MNRPRVAPQIVADITDNAPGRVRRKLDRDPSIAEQWEWTIDKDRRCTVSTGTEHVEFQPDENGVVSSADGLCCSCLLSPRCFHMLACLAVLEVSDLPLTPLSGETDVATPTAANNKEDSTYADIEAQNTLSHDQIDAAGAIWREAAAILAAGSRSAGALLQSRLIRAIHECRATGLHRLANTGLRVINDIREVRSNREDFDPQTLVADLSEVLRVSYLLHRPEAVSNMGLIGTARRRYADVSNLKLRGLFCEPIHTRAGHSGIVTYLMDRDGGLVSVSNVRMGGGNRVDAAWDSSIDVGRLTMSHKQLSQSGLLLQTGTMSIDRRLGAGQKTRAAKLEGNGWQNESIEARFNESLQGQASRILSTVAQQPELWPAGYDLLFLKGNIVGTDGYGCFLEVPQPTGKSQIVRLIPRLQDTSSLNTDNLEILSHSPGLSVKSIARVAISESAIPSNKPTTIPLATPLAIAPHNSNDDDTADRPKLILDKNWGSHANLNLHRLRSANIDGIADTPAILPIQDAGGADGLQTFRRRLEALAIGGRHSLPTKRVNELKREAVELKEQMQPTAGALLMTLTDSALDSETSFRGVRFPADPTQLAERWLACCTYESASRLEYQRSRWA